MPQSHVIAIHQAPAGARFVRGALIPLNKIADLALYPIVLTSHDETAAEITGAHLWATTEDSVAVLGPDCEYRFVATPLPTHPHECRPPQPTP